MAEQWSSKSHVWVRFLLSLFLKIKIYKKFNQNLYKLLLKNIKASEHTQLFTKLKYRLKDTIRVSTSKSSTFIFKKTRSVQQISSILNYRALNNLYFHFLKSFFFKYKKQIPALFISQHCAVKLLAYQNLVTKNYIFFLISYFKFFTLFKPLNVEFYNTRGEIFLFYFFYLNNAVTLGALLKFHQLLTGFVCISKVKNSKITKIQYFNRYRANCRNFSKPTAFAIRAPYRAFKQNWASRPPVIVNKQISHKNYLIFKKIALFEYGVFFKLSSAFLINLRTYLFVSYLAFARLYFTMSNALNRLYSNEHSRIFFPMLFNYVKTNLIRLASDSVSFDKKHFWLHHRCFKKNKNFLQPKMLSLFNSYLISDDLFQTNFFFITNTYKNNCINPIFKKSVKSLFTINNKLIQKKKFIFSYSYLSGHANNTFETNVTKVNYKTDPTLSNFETLLLMCSKPLFIKYFFSTKYAEVKIFNFPLLNDYFNNFFFYSVTQKFFCMNILPNVKFSYVLKRRLVKTFNNTKLPPHTILWYYQTIARFLEFCSGKRACIQFFPFLASTLNFYEKMQCLLWAQKVKYFRKVLGPRLFLNESLQIIYLSLKLKDPFVLSNWMVSTMYKISFWKYKTFLRYIKYVLRYFFWVIFKELKMKGIKYQLKGKISVAGNARTRTTFHYVGFTSHSTFNNKILYTLSLIRTFTGVLGLKLWIVF